MPRGNARFRLKRLKHFSRENTTETAELFQSDFSLPFPAFKTARKFSCAFGEVISLKRECLVSGVWCLVTEGRPRLVPPAALLTALLTDERRQERRNGLE